MSAKQIVSGSRVRIKTGYIRIVALVALLVVIGPSCDERAAPLNRAFPKVGSAAEKLGPLTEDTPCDEKFHLVNRFTRAKRTNVFSPAVSSEHLYVLETASVSGVLDNPALLRRWDGNTWERIPLPTPEEGRYFITALDVDDRDVLWAAGRHDTAAGDYSLVLTWDGQDWERIPSPQTRVTSVSDIEMWNSDYGWIVGLHMTGRNEEEPLALRWEGGEWELVEGLPDHDYDPGLKAVSISNPDEVWAIGVGAYQWDGSSWTERGSVRMYTYDVEAADGGVWIAGGRFVLSWDGSSWQKESIPKEPGSGGLFSIDGGSKGWGVGRVRNLRGTTALASRRGVSGWTTRKVELVGRGGQLTDLVVTADGTAWATGQASSRRGLFGVLHKACSP